MANKAAYDVAPGYHSECVFSHFSLANSTQVTQVSCIICCCLMARSFHTIQVSAQRLFYRKGGLHFIFPHRTYHNLKNYILSYPSVYILSIIYFNIHFIYIYFYMYLYIYKSIYIYIKVLYTFIYINYILSILSKHSTPLTKCYFTRIKDGVSFITISPLPIYST